MKPLYILRATAATLVGASLALTPLYAGVINGPVRTSSVVRARTADVYTEYFTAGKRAVVAVKGNGDVDLEVRDENGHLIASDRCSSPEASLSWIPKWKGRFKIRVINLTAKPIVYGMATN